MKQNKTIFQKKYINKQQVLLQMWRKGNPCVLLLGMQIGAATVENSMEYPQKIKNESAFLASNSTSWSIP